MPKLPDSHIKEPLLNQIEYNIRLGHDNKRIFNILSPDRPTTIENFERREQIARTLNLTVVPDFSETDERLLREYIRQVRSQITKIDNENAYFDQLNGQGGVQRLEDLEASSIARISTRNDELDWMYGATTFHKDHTDLDSDVLYREFGLPEGKLSLWAGEKGVGKTRTAISIAGGMNSDGIEVGFFQGEVSLSELKAWTAPVIKNPKNFFVSDQTHLMDQIATIMAYQPKVIVVDSLNMIQESRSVVGTRKVIAEYRKACSMIGAHTIFIGHLNKGGKVKGNSDIEYLMDVIVTLKKKEQGSPEFTIEIPEKNRYGCTGRAVEMIHNATGVETLSNCSLSEISMEKARKAKHLRSLGKK